jgi:hypothetical protein
MGRRRCVLIRKRDRLGAAARPRPLILPQQQHTFPFSPANAQQGLGTHSTPDAGRALMPQHIYRVFIGGDEQQTRPAAVQVNKVLQGFLRKPARMRHPSRKTALNSLRYPRPCLRGGIGGLTDFNTGKARIQPGQFVCLAMLCFGPRGNEKQAFPFGMRLKAQGMGKRSQLVGAKYIGLDNETGQNGRCVHRGCIASGQRQAREKIRRLFFQLWQIAVPQIQNFKTRCLHLDPFGRVATARCLLDKVFGGLRKRDHPGNP